MASDNSNNDSTSNQIQITITGKEEVEQPFLPSNCCIYKVHENLRKGNNDAYTPHLISIGPIHHKNTKLKSMEKQKRLYFRYFCAFRLTGEDLKDYRDYLQKNESKIRNCYSEEYTRQSDFVSMILLDAIFIMELFLRKSKDSEVEDDCIFNRPWLRRGIERDLLLAENQLPFFVLEKLYEHVSPFENKDRVGFLGLARGYFQRYDTYDEQLQDQDKPKHFTDLIRCFFGLARKQSVEEINKKPILMQDQVKPKHFTDLIRCFYVPQDLVAESSPRPCVVSAATKLKGAGISFSHVSYRCLLDVTFDKKKILKRLPCLSCLPYLKCVKARLLFPRLEVDDSTECVLRNLIAFEQCHYPQDPCICSYAFLLDSLIGDEEDAGVLVESGVIVNKLSSDKELARLINRLCKNVVISSNYYGTVSRDLYEHYHGGFWNKNMAELRLVYFRNLWRGSATIVGLLVLFITVFNFVRTNLKDF